MPYRDTTESKQAQSECGGQISKADYKLRPKLAVVFVENIQTDELCHYVADGSDPSGNVKDSGPPPLTPTTS